jgi:hypothetical protein
MSLTVFAVGRIAPQETVLKILNRVTELDLSD